MDTKNSHKEQGISGRNIKMERPIPILSLAPMQDVTDLNFWRLMHQYGGPDIYFTEYFRVTPTYRLSGEILKSIKRNPTKKPVIAQIIGNDISALQRAATDLQKYNIMGIDLNLGCPAPVVYKKKAGGGLLRYPDEVEKILFALRDVIDCQFSVKTRIGFDDDSIFDELLDIFSSAKIDLLTVHGRTVKEMYRSSVNYDQIRKANEKMNCPVWANGNIYSPEKAENVLNYTKASGLMIGRGAIRNPWIFEQIKVHLEGKRYFIPKGTDVLNYIFNLKEHVTDTKRSDKVTVQHLKKYMNFIGLGIEPQEQFLFSIRRAQSLSEFFRICKEFLDSDKPMNLTPFAPESLHPDDTLNGCHL